MPPIWAAPMAKVDFPSDPSAYISPHAYVNAHNELKKERAKEKAAVRAKPFSSLLGKAREEVENSGLGPAEIKEDSDIPSLLDDIHSAGDSLRSSSTRENLLKYKAAVKNFLHFVVKNGYTIGETWVRKSLLEKKKLTIVRLVDRKLEQLAAGILSGQKAGLELLARIEEINGLLVDLIQ